MIKIYISEVCDYCKELKDKLTESKIEFTTIDIDDEKNQEMVSKIFDFVGEPLIPIIIHENKILAPKRSFNTIEQAMVLIKSLI
jgi:glutaredoxin